MFKNRTKKFQPLLDKRSGAPTLHRYYFLSFGEKSIFSPDDKMGKINGFQEEQYKKCKKRLAKFNDKFFTFPQSITPLHPSQVMLLILTNMYKVILFYWLSKILTWLITIEVK